MQRLLKKFDTAATLVPQPVVRAAAQPSAPGVIYFGSTEPGDGRGARGARRGGHPRRCDAAARLPVPGRVREFIDAHDQVFVVEQNRDAQMRTLLVNELEIDPARLTPVLHYDGTPITARFITAAITQQVYELAIKPRKSKGGKKDKTIGKKGAVEA